MRLHLMMLLSFSLLFSGGVQADVIDHSHPDYQAASEQLFKDALSGDVVLASAYVSFVVFLVARLEEGSNREFGSVFDCCFIFGFEENSDLRLKQFVGFVSVAVKAGHSGALALVAYCTAAAHAGNANAATLVEAFSSEGVTAAADKSALSNSDKAYNDAVIDIAYSYVYKAAAGNVAMVFDVADFAAQVAQPCAKGIGRDRENVEIIAAISAAAQAGNEKAQAVISYFTTLADAGDANAAAVVAIFDVSAIASQVAQPCVKGVGRDRENAEIIATITTIAKTAQAGNEKAQAVIAHFAALADAGDVNAAAVVAAFAEARKSTQADVIDRSHPDYKAACAQACKDALSGDVVVASALTSYVVAAIACFKEHMGDHGFMANLLKNSREDLVKEDSKSDDFDDVKNIFMIISVAAKAGHTGALALVSYCTSLANMGDENALAFVVAFANRGVTAAADLNALSDADTVYNKAVIDVAYALIRSATAGNFAAAYEVSSFASEFAQQCPEHEYGNKKTAECIAIIATAAQAGNEKAQAVIFHFTSLADAGDANAAAVVAAFAEVRKNA